MITHVLDTCAVLDLAAGRWTRKEARRELVEAADPVVLAITVWEIARKYRVGKLQLPCEQEGIEQFVEAIAARHKLRLIPVTSGICHQAELLPGHHDDPFDRMILACAQAAGAVVFTTDRQFEAYPVKVVAQR